MLALTVWGFAKGQYDGNIWAGLFDVIPPRSRGSAAGAMNAIGWIGGGCAPVVVGWVSERENLSYAIAVTSLVYIVAAALLLTAILVFVERDTVRLETELRRA